MHFQMQIGREIIDDRTSNRAYILFLDSNVIPWSSKKQRCVARSSTEAEYRVVATIATEVIRVKSLLHELGVLLPLTRAIDWDNIGTTYLCANPEFHSRMKHITIDFYFVWEKSTKL